MGISIALLSNADSWIPPKEDGWFPFRHHLGGRPTHFKWPGTLAYYWAMGDRSGLMQGCQSGRAFRHRRVENVNEHVEGKVLTFGTHAIVEWPLTVDETDSGRPQPLRLGGVSTCRMGTE